LTTARRVNTGSYRFVRLRGTLCNVLKIRCQQIKKSDGKRESTKSPISVPVSPSNAVKCYPCRRVPLNYSTSLLFHGGDTGSTPVRDANTFNHFQDIAIPLRVQKFINKSLSYEYSEELSSQPYHFLGKSRAMCVGAQTEVPSLIKLRRLLMPQDPCRSRYESSLLGFGITMIALIASGSALRRPKTRTRGSRAKRVRYSATLRQKSRKHAKRINQLVVLHHPETQIHREGGKQ
jgi:hypothetical protein